MGGWGEIKIKANSAQLKLELGLSLAKIHENILKSQEKYMKIF
jgi:hypothetical protein